MPNLDWSKLNHLQLGRYAEYYAKMEFASYGFEVYSPEVDDHGIDFVIKKETEQFYEVQVKSVRGYNYIFFQKEKFKLRGSLLASIILFHDNHQPDLYLIPSLMWMQPNELLVSRDYKGLKSPPEWGLNVSAKNQSILDHFAFDRIAIGLK